MGNRKILNKKSKKLPEPKKRMLAVVSAFVLCGTCLSGCGVLDFFRVSQGELDTDEIITDIAGKEAEETAGPSLGENISRGNTGDSDALIAEENKVEEGAESPAPEELQKKREEIGLSEAGIIGLQEAQSGNYYFEQLEEQEKALYVEFYQILAMLEEEVLISTTDVDILPRVYQAVINDHPELFYLNGYNYTQYTRQDKVQYVTFSGRYLYDANEAARRQSLIDAVVQEKTGRLAGGDDYETVKRVYEDIILSTDYSMESPDNQNICSVFLDKKSVCNGYAKAAQYLLNDLGIRCTIVNGKTNGDSHAWNIVEIDGAYYHMDATWGDPSYYSSGAGEKDGAPEIDYSYLCVTDAEIGKNHSVDTEFTLPVCSAVKDNYFVREGLYLSGYDEDRVREIFEAAKAQGKSSVSIKASDGQVYREIYQKLIDEQKIFDHFGTYQASGEYRIAYSGNEEMNTISFWE